MYQDTERLFLLCYQRFLNFKFCLNFYTRRDARSCLRSGCVLYTCLTRIIQQSDLQPDLECARGEKSLLELIDTA